MRAEIAAFGTDSEILEVYSLINEDTFLSVSCYTTS
jgi:hypothetical protein